MRLSDHKSGDVPAEALEKIDVRSNTVCIEYIELRLRAPGRQRILRLTTSGTDANGLDLNEIQHPEGNPNAMQTRSFSLERA